MTDISSIDVKEGLIEEELCKHGSYASVTRGPSMRPLFKTGRDMVIIYPKPQTLKKYDVILYTGRKNRYTLHRIIGRRGDTLVVRGDNTYKKEYIPESDVIGILKEYNRRGKHGTVDTRRFRAYSVLWNFIYPIRFVAVKIKHALGRCYRAIFKRKRK